YDALKSSLSLETFKRRYAWWTVLRLQQKTLSRVGKSKTTLGSDSMLFSMINIGSQLNEQRQRTWHQFAGFVCLWIVIALVSIRRSSVFGGAVGCGVTRLHPHKKESTNVKISVRVVSIFDTRSLSGCIDNLLVVNAG